MLFVVRAGARGWLGLMAVGAGAGKGTAGVAPSEPGAFCSSNAGGAAGCCSRSTPRAPGTGAANRFGGTAESTSAPSGATRTSGESGWMAGAIMPSYRLDSIDWMRRLCSSAARRVSKFISAVVSSVRCGVTNGPLMLTESSGGVASNALGGGEF